MFIKRNQKHVIRTHGLTLQDFQYLEVEALYSPTFINPGRNSMFTAVVGLSNDQVRKCSTAEYFHLTGSNMYQKKFQRMKDEFGMLTLESSTPTTKTPISTTYNYCTIHALNKKGVLLCFMVFRNQGSLSFV